LRSPRGAGRACERGRTTARRAHAAAAALPPALCSPLIHNALARRIDAARCRRRDVVSQPLITYRGTIYPWQCDHVGHMNAMWYVGKFDEATWQLFNAIGLTPSYLRQERRGMAAVDQHISYVRELHAGDVVTVRTTVVEVKDKSIRFVHEMSNDETGEVAARTTLKGVHIDTVARKSCSFEEVIARRAEAMVAGAARR
jgi:acyl-CoA thioester hydrolase